MTKEWFPLTQSQYQIWISGLTAEEPGLYLLHTILSGRVPIQAEAMGEAVRQTADANEVFALEFGMQDGTPVQRLTDHKSECQVHKQMEEMELQRILNRRNTTADYQEEYPYDFGVYERMDGMVFVSLQIHHLLIDGFGFSLFCSQILDRYEAIRKNLTPDISLPGEDRAFYAKVSSGNLTARFVPQNASQSLVQKEADQQFWEQYLSQLPMQELPMAQQAETMQCKHVRMQVPDELTEQIREFCRQEQVSVYPVFAAAIGCYLNRITNRSDSVLIIPRLGRRSDEELRAVGTYTLAMPCRIHTEETLLFAEVCRTILKDGHAISQHKQYGYSQIAEDWKKQGGTGALSAYTLNYQKGTLAHSDLADLTFQVCGAMQNALTLTVSDWGQDGCWELAYDYRSELYEEEQVVDLNRSLLQIITQGIRGKTIGQLDLLSPEELQKIQERSLGKTSIANNGDTIVSLFTQAVKQYRGKLAFAACDCSGTYEELSHLSNQIAYGLHQAGVKKKDLVAVMLKRTSRYLISILGILKCGAAFLPIDPTYPKERAAFMVEDSQAVCTITDENYDTFMSNKNWRFVPDVLVQKDDVAYCIYTSGTTGMPKGVLLSHRGIVNITRPDNNPFNEDMAANGHGIVAIGAFTFDISLFELFVPLLNGKFVVIAEESAMVDPRKIAGLLLEYGADILHSTPSRLASYLGEPDFVRALKQVEVILSAGEVLPRELVHQLQNAYSLRIYNGYGPTEITIGASITQAFDRASIGRPIANMGIYVLNERQEYQPWGMVGELAVTGAGVGLQYLNREDLTKQRFIRLPDGERCYLTGDHGYYQADHSLVYLGRKDGQVKLRGLRIELAEIEARMQQYPGILLCAVLIREVEGIRHLTAYYTVGASYRERWAEGGLRSYLERFLIYYMVPDILVELTDMPMNLNGKIDQKALLAIPVTYGRTYEAPKTEEEAILCQIYEKVLEIEKVGAGDNFFEIGGTSLTAVEVMIQAKAQGIVFSYGDIFKEPTPRRLLEHLLPEEKEDLLQTLDYTEIEPVLERQQAQKRNTKTTDAANRETADTPSLWGNVLLTGANGFLGIHILRELLEQENTGIIYCLVRSKGAVSANKRLNAAYFYYFEDGLVQEERVRILDMDLTSADLEQRLEDLSIQTVVNAAANVAHFAYGDRLQKVNEEGVKRLIEVCEKKQAKLIHISTISVGGYSPSIERVFREDCLYIGQNIQNAYIISKFLAEYHLLCAAAKGLPVKIMRVGNLQGRLSDGEFQMNLKQNAFTKQLRAYAQLASMPESIAKRDVNISPVDETARAVVLLGKQGKGVIFHVYHPAGAAYMDIRNAFTELGYPMEIVPEETFLAIVEAATVKEGGKQIAEGILLEQDKKPRKENQADCGQTVEQLKEYGFTWGNITRSYLATYLKALETMGFFDKEIQEEEEESE